MILQPDFLYHEDHEGNYTKHTKSKSNDITKMFSKDISAFKLFVNHQTI